MTQSAPTQEPILKVALGPDWELLPEVLQKGFTLYPGRDCEVRLKGTMYEVSYPWFARLFIYPGQLFGALVPWQGRNVPIRIDIRTHASDSRFMYWHRAHAFVQSPEFLFSSKMEYLEGRDLIERVRFGLGLRMRVRVENRQLIFESVCYQWDFLGLRLRIPNWLLLGRGRIVEREISPEQFEMFFDITHPLWGRTFTYNGIFSFV